MTDFDLLTLSRPFLEPVRPLGGLGPSSWQRDGECITLAAHVITEREVRERRVLSAETTMQQLTR